VRVHLRLVTAAFVLGSASFAFMPVATAASDTKLSPSREAWFQPNPTCAQASGCLAPGNLPVAPPVAVPLSPYPAGTMHIGYTGGQETARSYLALPVDSVTGLVRSASLDIPLDVSTADGSQLPETAKIQACLFTGDITTADGSIAPPPAPSCDDSAPVAYVATPAPHLHADLAAVKQGLLTSSGIALLPDGTKVAPSDSWRVVFSAHTRSDAAKTAPASVVLTLEDGRPHQPTDTPTVALPDSNNPGLSVAPPVGTGFAPAPAVNPPADIAPSQAAAPIVTNPVAQPQTVTVGYAYPAVWLLPLAFLILIPAAARALTKDLAPL
jgi:hypothetical protein